MRQIIQCFKSLHWATFRYEKPLSSDLAVSFPGWQIIQIMLKRKPKVFLMITIPTHLRALMGTANLLLESGRFEPCLLYYQAYYPSSAFDLNLENCRQAPHPVFVWNGQQFLSKKESAADISNHQRFMPDSRLSLVTIVRESLLGDKGLLRGMLRVFRARATLEGCARIGLSLIIATQFLPFFLRSIFHPGDISWNTRLRQIILDWFDHAWKCRFNDEANSASVFSRIRTEIMAWALPGIAEQKIFYSAIHSLLNEERPNVVVLPEENFFYNHHLVVYAAQKLSIPCVVVPFTISNTLDLAENFWNACPYQANGRWNGIFAKIFPHWVLVHRGRRLILPPIYILICENLGIVPDKPWLINSGPAEKIAVESPFMMNYYLRAGIRSDKLALVGAPSDDRLFKLFGQREARRLELFQKFGIVNKTKMILLSLPPDAFSGGNRPGCEFDDYDELIKFMVTTMVKSCSPQQVVLVNLHPRVLPERVSYIESFGVRIIPTPIESLVPLADLFVAVISATIRIAISCGVPTVNYDALQHNFDDYKGLPGVCEVKKKTEFESVIHRLLTDEAFCNYIAAAQRETARQQCLIDGQAEQRILSLFDQLASGKAACVG